METLVCFSKWFLLKEKLTYWDYEVNLKHLPFPFQPSCMEVKWALKQFDINRSQDAEMKYNQEQMYNVGS